MGEEYGKTLPMHLLTFLGPFYNKFIEIIGLEALGNNSASIWYNLFDLFMGEPQTLR